MCTRSDKGLYCGQNCYTSWSTMPGSTKSLAAAVQDWYDEVEEFDNDDVRNYGIVTRLGSGETGHFTQVTTGTKLS